MVAKLGNSHWHKERPREQVWGAGEGGEVAASNSWQSSCKENRAGDISAPGKVPSGVVGWAPRGGAPPSMDGIKLLVPVPLQMDLPRAVPSRGASTVSPHPMQTHWLCPHRRQERPHQASTAAGELGCPAVPLPTGSDTSLSLSWQLSEGKMMERRKKIALELSELVVYCRPVPFDEESEHLLVSCHRRQTPWRRRPRCVPPGCCPGLWLACS